MNAKIMSNDVLTFDLIVRPLLRGCASISIGTYWLEGFFALLL